MQDLSNKSRSNSNSNINDEDSSFEQTASVYDRSLIFEANKRQSLLSTFRNYNINIHRFNQYDEWSISISCPFSFHKSGQERTASFGYNFVRDKFHCFGCNTSGGTVEFISYKDGSNKVDVAIKIIRDVVGYIPNNLKIVEDINPKIDALLFDFSDFIFKLNMKYKINPNVLEQIEKITWWFDNYIVAAVPKHKVSVEELSLRISKAKEILRSYE